eukprot:4709703-Pyramimonas_sp.AAC.1
MARRRKRAPCWRSSTDTDTASVLEPIVARTLHIAWRDGRYPSDHMRRSINVPYLVEASDSLKQLAALDARGGFFSQDDMKRAVMKACTEQKHEQSSMKLARDIVKPHGETLALVAYSYRVMMSHVREKYEQYITLKAKACGSGEVVGASPSHPTELIEIYDIWEASGLDPRRKIGGPVQAKNPF